MGIFKDMFKGYDKAKATKKLTYEELYDLMKEGEFPCGKPELTGTGMMRCIKFPAVDKYVIQVAITGQTITTSKVYSGVGGLLKETAGDALSNGYYSVLNGQNLDMNKMTEIVTKEIARLLGLHDLLAK